MTEIKKMYNPNAKLIEIGCSECGRKLGTIYAGPEDEIPDVICCKNKGACVNKFKENILPKIEVVKFSESEKPVKTPEMKKKD